MARNSLKNVCRLIDAVKEEIPVEQQFLGDLKRSIELSADKDFRLPSKTYKPSSMNCMRASYYQILGVEPIESSSSYSLVGICNSGTDIHVRMQTAIEEMRQNGMECDYIDVAEFVRQRELSDLDIVSKSGMETKLYHKRFNMSFMCDGIIKYKNHYYILELKTENSYKFVARKGVDEGHYNQATAYSLAFGLDKVLFVYISRDVLDMKAFILDVTEDMRKSLIMYITECNTFIERGEVPPKLLGSKNNKVCNYCMYKAQCRKDL